MCRAGFLTFCVRLPAVSYDFVSLRKSNLTIRSSIDIMPVPRRRRSKGLGSLVASPTVLISSLLDIDFIFQRSKTLIYYGFAPMVIYFGMTTEPTPASWFELINIF